jgi:hypothetical protein
MLIIDVGARPCAGKGRWSQIKKIKQKEAERRERKQREEEK